MLVYQNQLLALKLIIFCLNRREGERVISNFQDLFSVSFSKLNKYLEDHPCKTVYNFYKAAHIFDPRQLPCITHDIDSFAVIKDFQDPSTELVEEFQIYVNYKDDLILISQHFGMQIRASFLFYNRLPIRSYGCLLPALMLNVHFLSINI